MIESEVFKIENDEKIGYYKMFGELIDVEQFEAETGIQLLGGETGKFRLIRVG